MGEIQEGQLVWIKGHHGSAMCGHLLESLVGKSGIVVGTYEDFYWVLIDGEKYLLSFNDLEVV